MAATTLSGLLQCNFLTMDSPMQIHFEQLCKQNYRRKGRREPWFCRRYVPSAGNKTGRKHLLGISRLAQQIFIGCLCVCRSMLGTRNSCF